MVICLGVASHSHDIYIQDTEKAKARQARFGVSKESTKPITAPVVDEAEARKRKAREERFGANPGVRIVCFLLSSDSDKCISLTPKSLALAHKLSFGNKDYITLCIGFLRNVPHILRSLSFMVWCAPPVADSLHSQ